MSNILIINGAKKFAHSNGQLNDTLTEVAESYLRDASKKYGSGGLVQGKKYMLSLTWNAPMEAFTDKDQFFHGVGVDGVYLPFHKANQFLGMEALPTFIANDVIKMPDVPRYIAEYRKHLAEIFG